MDISEEPQRKVFKARKTMKASDRQQLETIHKAKEELLKPAELTLINGNHENGDLDKNFVHNTDSLGDRNDLHDIINTKYEDTPHVNENVFELKEDLRNVDLVSDLKKPTETSPSHSIPCQDASKDEAGAVALLVRSICSDPPLSDSAFEINGRRVGDGLSLVESLSSDADLSEHSQLNTPVEGESLCIEKELNVNLSLVENVTERKLDCEAKVSCLNLPNDTEAIELELHNLDTLDHVEKLDCLDKNDQKEVAEEDLSGDKIQTTEEGQESVRQEENVESVDKQKTDLMPDLDVIESDTSLRENEDSDTLNTQAEQDIGDVATSSNMEVDQPLETFIEDISSDKTGLDVQPGTAVENVNSMETDEIIPILEKLAPVEDVLQCFSNSPLRSGSVADEERSDIAGTPSKIVSDCLPSEAFLVLSDEEEILEKNITKESSSNDDQVTKEAPQIEVQQKQDNAHDAFVEEDKSEIFQRKRSKSEDLDSQISKRRRFEREEYEAELKVKITAGDDVNKKLQKVIQRMFEEKLSALQCADFDKAISELKMRVEKIECKKHENVLHSIQAKITRLTKRFGTAKEDLKRRPEQSAATQPASPGKPAVTDLTAVSSSNSAIYRNGSTVRQMLESKRNVGETTTAHLQTQTSAPQSVANTANITVRTSNATQISPSQPPTNATIQTRAPPDWKLIQQKINAQNTSTTQQKSNPPVTSTPAISSVLSAATTATVVGNSQVSTSTSQAMSVSLQSLPVILHVPLAVPSQSQILQGTTGTLVTNQQSGNVEFIPVQNQSSVSNLTKTPVTLPVTKAINSPTVPSSSIQRNSPASSVPSTLTVQAISANHPVTLSSRPSVPTVGSSSIYNQTSNRSTAQLKTPVSGYSSSSEPPSGSRAADSQNSRVPAAEITTSKRPTDSNVQGGKPSAGVIDLTLDDEDPELSSRDRRTNSMALSASVQQSQTVGRQSQPVQMNNLQTPANVAISSQATIHVLPTAQTTVNVTQRPGNPNATRAPAPRAPNAPHMVYTTTTMPTTPVQTPIRNAVVQSQNVRQMTPQAGGVPVRMQQTTSYVVNNGISMASGPQLTVHHRPPQETAKLIHPAPLPEAPQPLRLPPEATSTSPPQKPHLKLARVQSQNGIVLSWSVLEVDRSCAAVDSYHLYAYHEDPSATSPSQWKKIGEVKALPLPMACTLTQFVSGSKYYFAVRAKDIYGRFGPFCDPQSTDVISTQSS